MKSRKFGLWFARPRNIEKCNITDFFTVKRVAVTYKNYCPKNHNLSRNSLHHFISVIVSYTYFIYKLHLYIYINQLTLFITTNSPLFGLGFWSNFFVCFNLSQRRQTRHHIVTISQIRPRPHSSHVWQHALSLEAV